MRNAPRGLPAVNTTTLYKGPWYFKVTVKNSSIHTYSYVCVCRKLYVLKKDVSCMHGGRAGTNRKNYGGDKRIFVRKILCKLWRYVNFNLWKNTFLCLFADRSHEYVGEIRYVSSPRWNNPIFVRYTFWHPEGIICWENLIWNKILSYKI